jgi:hypothetical protein
MVAIPSEFQVNISHKHWACVLDSTLALSQYGLPLLARLGDVVEVWIARELWHILDNTHFYLERPEALLATDEQGSQTDSARTMVQTLLEWERVRLENDPTRQHCYWIGDSPLESFLPEAIEPDIVWQYEAISAALDKRLPDNAPLSSACRDTATLAVCLPTAFVLTYLPSFNSNESSPSICRMLNASGIPCQKVATDDLWQQQESELLRQLLVQTGVSKWVWSGLKLAILQIAAPAACTVNTQRLDQPINYGLNETTESSIDYWREARGFWYPL